VEVGWWWKRNKGGDGSGIRVVAEVEYRGERMWKGGVVIMPSVQGGVETWSLRKWCF